MQSEASVEIDRPIDEVFDYANNHVPEWSLTVVEDEIIEEKPEGVGTTFRCVTEGHGGRMEFQGVVTHHDPPTASAVELTGKSFDIDVEYLFEDLSGRTRLTQRSKVHARGFTKVIFVLFGWLMNKSGCRAAKSELVNLKRMLESRETSST